MTADEATRIVHAAALTPDAQALYDDLVWVLDEQPPPVTVPQVPVLVQLLSDALVKQLAWTAAAHPSATRWALLERLCTELGANLMSLLTAKCVLAGVLEEQQED